MARAGQFDICGNCTCTSASASVTPKMWCHWWHMSESSTHEGPYAPDPVGAEPPVAAAPLRPDDPVKVGDFWLDARLTASPAGVGYAAHDDAGSSVLLIMLSEGAALDAAARARLAGEVNAMHIDTVLARGGQGQDDGRMAVRYRDEDDDPVAPHHAPLAPWVALAFSGTAAGVTEADRVLAAVDLARTPSLGTPSGPDYRLHWIDNTKPGASRLWPLPWPGRHDRAGWISILASWLLMLLLAALAILLAIVVFQNQPPTSSPDPVPTQASGQGSDSASPQSGSPSPGTDTDPSDSPSMEVPSPGASASGPGTPTPERRLSLER